MTIDELCEALYEIASREVLDPELAHAEADDLLLRYIDSDRVQMLFNQIEKWYA